MPASEGGFLGGRYPLGRGIRALSGCWEMNSGSLDAGHVDVYMYKNSSSCTLGVLYCVSVIGKEN